jgi:hypothetical protein
MHQKASTTGVAQTLISLSAGAQVTMDSLRLPAGTYFDETLAIPSSLASFKARSR